MLKVVHIIQDVWPSRRLPERGNLVHLDVIVPNTFGSLARYYLETIPYRAITSTKIGIQGDMPVWLGLFLVWKTIHSFISFTYPGSDGLSCEVIPSANLLSSTANSLFMSIKMGA